ncbi:hypothetical protein BO94DRAFT_279493 [Aspergillus sclerotioniger CBS 115572]|uniref:Uncharacterized protein n=1 Tax=Aspergillus sclerotioniger CBS 115572 TaxID=1450535 RepID=A0A317X7L8_9EURO|nr:hypothetical protein BO94DRAFT_279493 [Aspergillus sclerotioniger CBS 115572]PWY94604.1 hypothetical protein BO94DRAFT_279493 [Aspergillus sclerotioniger CBS 115572]
MAFCWVVVYDGMKGNWLVDESKLDLMSDCDMKTCTINCRKYPAHVTKRLSLCSPSVLLKPSVLLTSMYLFILAMSKAND